MRRLLSCLFISLFFLPLAIPARVQAQTATGTLPAAIENATSANGDATADPNIELEDHEGAYERAIVRSVDLAPENTPTGAKQKQRYIIEYLSGPLKGQTRTLSTDIDSNPYNLQPQPGDKVVIYLQHNPTGTEPIGFLESYDRRGAMIWLVILFVLMLIVLAGWQGLKVALSIFVSIALIGLVLIPAFLKGMNPVPVAMVLTVVLTGLSTTLATGWNKKSAVTIVGTLGGVIVAYVISVVFSHWAHLGGLSTEEDRLFFSKNPGLNAEGLLFAGIIIAAMGVVEDVAVSISSGVAEVRRANPGLGFKQLFTSGMIVGRDHMSALANTLIFAYVGASLSTLLLYHQFDSSWLKFLNFDSVVDEIVRSLSGTIGLIFTVPITALLAALVATSNDKTQGRIHRATAWQPPDKETEKRTL